MGYSKQSGAGRGLNLIRRFGTTLKGGLRADHVGRLWEQLLGNHSGCAGSALSCSVAEYLSVPRESKGTKARAAGVTVRRVSSVYSTTG